MLEVPSLLEPLGFDYVLYTHGDGLNSLAHGHYNFSRRKSGISFLFIFFNGTSKVEFSFNGKREKIQTVLQGFEFCWPSVQRAV